LPWFQPATTTLPSAGWIATPKTVLAIGAVAIPSPEKVVSRLPSGLWRMTIGVNPPPLEGAPDPGPAEVATALGGGPLGDAVVVRHHGRGRQHLAADAEGGVEASVGVESQEVELGIDVPEGQDGDLAVGLDGQGPRVAIDAGARRIGDRYGAAAAEGG